MTTRPRFANGLRRYPALGFLAVAALLASLLPSALRVPLSGPSASAELAPVPGKSDSAQGDLSALGQTSTGGLGAGGGTGAVGRGGPGGPGGADGTVELPLPPDGSGRNLRNKRCVGNRPRQTEDPLSPPCVAFFRGDNGGATAKGVTRDEIRVVLWSNCNSDGSFTTTEVNDIAGDPYGALARYFNERFQTYERRVRVIRAEGTTGQICNRTAFLQRLAEQVDPFYVVPLPPDFHSSAPEAARLGMMFSMSTPARALTEAHAPLVVGYGHDLEDWAANIVEATCSRLAGRPARFAGDVTMHGRTRSFALDYDVYGDPDRRGEQLIRDGIRRQCGSDAGEVVACRCHSTSEFARLRTSGVTTVVVARVGVSAVTLMAQAEASGWFPEWFLATPHDVGNNRLFRQMPPAQASNSFGLMTQRRLGAPAGQYHQKAMAEGGCSSCNASTAFFAYEQFLLLFTGIQAAGPRLTPATFDRGLRALPARQSRDPFAPSAYFAPGNHTFLKDFAFAWWDPTGLPPGGSTPGCWRLVEDGLRYRAEDWRNRPGDDGIKGDGQPCQGDGS